MSSTAGAIPTPVLRHAAQAAAQALLSLLIALAMVMVLRRLSGAFVQPPSALTLVFVAITLVAVAAAARVMLLGSVGRTVYFVLSTQNSVRITRHRAHAISTVSPSVKSTDRLIFILPGLAAVVLLAALTMIGTPPLAIAFAWFVLIGTEGLSWLAACGPAPACRTGEPRAVSNRIAIEESTDEPETELPAGLVQQLTRVRDNGRESIHAVLLAEIPPGDRQTAIHLAFCPPLDQKPELTAHALDADDADVRITQAETFGARIELRLPAVAAKRRTALVELLGSATCQ